MLGAMDTLSPDGMASAIERARYSGLRKEPWEDLRDTERDTRVEVMRAALEESGVVAAVAAVVARGAQADGLAEQVAARDAEPARAPGRARRGPGAADRPDLRAWRTSLADARAAHAAEPGHHDRRVRVRLAEARSGEQRAVHRAQQAERALDAVRNALAGVAAAEPLPVVHEAVADDDGTAAGGCPPP